MKEILEAVVYIGSPILLVVIIIIIIRCACRRRWSRACGKCCLPPIKRRQIQPILRRKLKPSVTTVTYTENAGNNRCYGDLQLCAGCIYLYSPVNCKFANHYAMELFDAISRYSEEGYRPPLLKQLFDNIKSNRFTSLILQEINNKNPQFFFKILLTGSLRERAGVPLPSTSILATDCDLMIIPDTVVVGTNVETNSQYDCVPTFEITDNQNGREEKGHCWLKLRKTKLKVWKDLCLERGAINKNEAEYYLSQEAVYDLIKKSITESKNVQEYVENFTDENGDISSCNCCYQKSQKKKVELKVERNGPACTVFLKHENCEEGEEIMHSDFTFGLYCQYFPSKFQSFFERRTRNSGECHWPPEDVVDKIKKIGCHVVPKPSSFELVFLQDEQSENPYLGNNTLLEWRMSFSMGEALLFDNLPPIARKAFLAFKALIKTHINGTVDYRGNIYKIESYALKTILLWLVERKPKDFWCRMEQEDGFYADFNEVVVVVQPRNMPRKTIDNLLYEKIRRNTAFFFEELFTELIVTLDEKYLKHFWNPSINLYSIYSDEEFSFLIDALHKIQGDFFGYLVNEWLECQRCMRFNCFRCYHPPLKETTTSYVITNSSFKKCKCLQLPWFRYDEGTPNWRVDPTTIEVY